MNGLQRLRENRSRLENATEEARAVGRLRWPLAALVIIVLSLLAWTAVLTLIAALA